ncbi:MAG: glucose 1-dehydrogenase [Candidatus Bipolaricaulis sp.]|nr:glucose 1-dehydrogenase [Candidatus Bipolaricaulis sp.]
MSLVGADLKGKVAVITGGSSGIGLGLSLAFAELGCHVVPTSEPGTEARVQETVRKLSSLGVRSLALTTDVTCADQVDRLMERTVKELGRLDVVVNCAGITIRTPSVDMSEKDWRAVIDINLTGTFLVCQRAGRVMLKQRSGSLINIASLCSYVAYPEVVGYCASKGGVIMVTRALAAEWAASGVRVNAIAPGDILTPLTRSMVDRDPDRRKRMESRIPMGRLGEVEEVAGAAIYLASDASQYVTGHTIVVDGGHLAQGI